MANGQIHIESDSRKQENETTILDACCGSRMMWFNKRNPDVIFGDIRNENHTLCDGRSLEIRPDLDLDFRDMPFPDERFHLIVFDPPHLIRGGDNSWMVKKYGRLNPEWKADLSAGFSECFRVLKPNGTLIFKWNETQIPVSQIAPLSPYAPLFGHKSGKQQKTHWLTFMKPPSPSHRGNVR